VVNIEEALEEWDAAGGSYPMTEVDARDVLEKYIAVLNTQSKSLIRDETELPYPKDVIRLVIKGCLARTDDSQTRERLKIAYQATADFQRLTDEERQAIAIMKEVDKPARWGSELFIQQVSDVIKYGPTQEAVAKRLVAEAEALFLDIKSL
jgi:hypothetical protein